MTGSLIPINLTWETDGEAIVNVKLDDTPLTELGTAALVDVVVGLIESRAILQRRLGSPGLERRAWRDMPPEDRKPGASLIDRGGVR